MDSDSASASNSDVDSQVSLLQGSRSRRRRDSDNFEDSDDGRGRKRSFSKKITDHDVAEYLAKKAPKKALKVSKKLKAVSGYSNDSNPFVVALVLCQSDHVLIDGQSGSEQSRNAVLDGVRQKLIEKVVRDHEDDDGGGSSSD